MSGADVPEWLRAAAAAAEADPGFRHEARWLRATILLNLPEGPFAMDVWDGRILDVHAGEPLTGWAFEIVGTVGQWTEALRPRRDLGEATMAPSVALRVRGDRVLAATHWGAVTRLLALLGRARASSAEPRL